MRKDTVQTVTKAREKKRQMDSLATLSTLALWRLRQTWWQLLMTGVALLAASTIACVPTLFSSVADTAGLQELFNGSPTRTTFALAANANSISSATVPAALQSFEKVIRPGLGSYLDASPASAVITTSKIVIKQPESLNHTNPLSVYATSIQRLQSSLHLLQGHWAHEQMTNGVFEIMLSAPTAQALGLTIGTTLTLQSGSVTTHATSPADPRGQIVVRLAGIFATPTTDAPALHGETFQPVIDYTGPNYTFLMSDSAFLQACDQIAARKGDTVVSASQVDNPFRLTWYYHLRTAQLQFGQADDFTSRLTNVQYKINSLRVNGPQGFPFIVDAAFYNPSAANADVLSLLSQYTSRIALIDLPISLLALQIVALLLFFACLLVNQLVDRQMAMSALLNSRGASTRQILWPLIFQVSGLSLLALLLGPLLGSLLVYKLAFSLLPANELTAFTGLFNSPAQILALLAPSLAGTFLGSLLATGLPCRRATHVNMLELRRETTRASKQPFWLRYYLDLLAAVLALGSFGVALYLAQIARSLDLRAQELVVAPLTLVTPLFLLLGGLLLFLRAFPLVLRFVTHLSRPARGTTSLLALTQMARTPHQATRLIMLLALASSFAAFSLIFNASQNQRSLDIAAYESGADFSGTLSGELVTQVQQDLARVSTIPPEQLSPQVQQELMARYKTIPGVLADSIGYAGAGSSIGLNNLQMPIELRAVDTPSFAHTAIWGPQDSVSSLQTLMDLLRQYSASASSGLVVPAIVDETTLSNLHLILGNTFEITSNIGQIGGLPISFQVIAVVQHIPGINGSAGVTDPSSSGGVLVDYQTFNDVYLNYQIRIAALPPMVRQSLPVNHIWLRTNESPGVLTSVRAALNSTNLALNNLYDRRAIIGDLQGDPLVFSILLMLNLGGITALVLAFLGNVLTSWMQVRLRLNNFVVLRALGATRWQVVSILLWEQGIVYLAALLLTLVFGTVLAWLVVPQLVFTSLPPHGALSEISAAQFYLLQRSLPPQVVIPESLQLALPALILLYSLVLLLMARMVLSASYGQELRLNED